MNKQNDILVVLEYHSATIHPVGFELLGTALQLSWQGGGKVHGVVIGQHVEECKPQLSGYPFASVTLYEASTSFFDAQVYAAYLCNCIEVLQPSIVLLGGTAQGRAIAPRAAVHFRTGLTADCTELFLRDDGLLCQVRPAFGGNIMAQIITPHTRPQFATVRPSVMEAAAPVSGYNALFHLENSAKIPASTLTLLAGRAREQSRNLTSATALVAAGKGLQNKRDLEIVKELAAALNGELCCSRGLVERGWLAGEYQIGLSGNTVAPQLLITCGISGSVQFLAGMRRAKTIVAINNDPAAPIFSIAHQPYCADLYTLVPQLLAQLKNH